MEIGVYTFGDVTTDPVTGNTLTPAQRHAEIVAAAKLADEAGLEVFGIGEHHRLDIPLSSPAVVMGALATVTERIRLTSAVTILSTLDPVRVFQDFATVDVLSAGRAEIIAGRGAFTESFPLFGHDLADYDALFAEKLPLLLAMNEAERLTWQGRFRPALREAEISPRPVAKIPIWLGVGGTPTSAQRAGDMKLPLCLANIFQPPAHFKEQIADYRRRHPAGRVAIATHTFVAKDSQTAHDEFHPRYSAYFQHHAPKPEFAAATPRDVFDKRASPTGPIFVGSPQQIIDKLMYEHELFGGVDRFLAQMDLGGMPFAQVARAIELLATEVVPVVRKL